MGSRAKAQYEISAKDKTDSALKSVEKNIKGIDKAMLAVKATIGLAFGAAGLGLIIRNTIEAEKVTAQLEARLKSTGGAAGLTKDELLDMASGLQKMTAFGDEAIVSAENLLLTFTNIGKNTFPSALEAVLDMSTALDQDLKSSAILVGKALNDPILGISALSRTGIQFTEDQKAVIKALVDTGNTAGAQTLILRELEMQMGGSARAARDTLGGALESLKNNFGDLFETDASLLTADLNTLTDLLIDPETQQAAQTFTGGLIGGLTKGIDLFRDAIGLTERLAEKLAAFTTGQKFITLGEDELIAEGVRIEEEIIAIKQRLNDGDTSIMDFFVNDRADSNSLEELQKDLQQVERLYKNFTGVIVKTTEDAGGGKPGGIIGQVLIGGKEGEEIVTRFLLQHNKGLESTSEQWRSLESDVVSYVDELEEVGEEAEKLNGIAQELGLTFTSAFEDAVIGGDSFHDVLGGLFNDIQRIILRKTVTEPLGEAIGSIDFGGIFTSLFGGAKAAGGDVSGGTPYLVGEQGPEIFAPGRSGTIIPNDKISGGMSVVQNITIDARGSDISEAKLEAAARRGAKGGYDLVINDFMRNGVARKALA